MLGFVDEVSSEYSRMGAAVGDDQRVRGPEAGHHLGAMYLAKLLSQGHRRADPDVIASLTTMFTGVGAFQATFSTTAWFADQVLWLAPEHPEPFRRPTQLVTASHPTLLPYGGAFDEVVPHLTVGDGGGPDLAEAEKSIRLDLPVVTQVKSVTLITQSAPGSHFQATASFPLA